MQLNQGSWLHVAVRAGIGFLMFPIGVHAGARAIEAGDHLNDQAAPRADFLSPKETAPFTLPPVESPADTSSSEQNAVKFKIDRVVFQGNSVFPEKTLAAIAASYVGRVVSAAELEELRRQLTKFYIDHGYVNSGVLLSKKPVDGVIVFQVVEGSLSGIRLQGMGRLNDDYVIKRLENDKDEPLNINDLRERFQLLLSDPLFERMNARLIPDTDLGSAQLDIDVQRARPYQLTAAFDNYRPPSVGSEEINLSGTVHNLTRFGDSLEFGIQAPPSLKLSGLRESLVWYVPIGYRGTGFSFAIDHGFSAVEEESLQALAIRSTLNSRDVGVNQTLINTLRNKFIMGLDYVKRENTTTLLGTPYSFIQQEPNGVSDESLWRFWQEYTYRSETQVLVLRSTFTFGSNNAEDLTGLPSSVTAIPSDYRIWLGQVQYDHQVLENGAQIIFRYTVQTTHDKMLPLDGISIGGHNTVRGFVENQLVTDKGQVANVEFEYPILRNEIKLVLIPFYDIGKGQNIGEVVTTISSAGLEARGQWGHVGLDISAAKKLVYPGSIISPGAALQDKGVYFQLAYHY